MKKKLCYLGAVLLAIPIILIILALVTVQLTYVPVTKLTRIGFQGPGDGMVYTLHPDYESLIPLVNEQLDVIYPSSYENNTYDVYYPKQEGSYPLLLWVHGGAFVGGDKKDNRTYMEMLASNGYVVVSMNYALVPEYSYPTPLYQMNEVYQKLKQENYPIDFDQILIGGDSAGAHIAGQFTTIQTNASYQTLTNIPAVMTSQQIKGFVSFCGLLDILAYDETDSWFSNFLYDQSAWGYFQSKQWKSSDMAKQADFLPYLTHDFPPVFLTDGKINSFLPQAESMKTRCEKSDIPVTLVHYPDQELPHEYQFQLERNEALTTYDKVIEFMYIHTKK